MNKKHIEILVRTDYVCLGQFLKLANLISTGGEAKEYLSRHKILIDNIEDNRRGRKLFPGSVIEVQDKSYVVRKE